MVAGLTLTRWPNSGPLRSHPSEEQDPFLKQASDERRGLGSSLWFSDESIGESCRHQQREHAEQNENCIGGQTNPFDQGCNPIIQELWASRMPIAVLQNVQELEHSPGEEV